MNIDISPFVHDMLRKEKDTDYIKSQSEKLMGKINNITGCITNHYERRAANNQIAHLVINAILEVNPDNGVIMEIEDIRNYIDNIYKHGK